MRSYLFIWFFLTISSLSAADPENPYEWLEHTDDNRTQDWLKQQQMLFKDYTTSNSIKKDIRSSLEQLIQVDEHSIPLKSGDNYFYTKKSPSEDHAILYRQVGIQGTPQVIFDPNMHKGFHLESFVISPNGNYIAYGISEYGSDWITYRVKHMDSLEDTTDRIEKIKFSPIVWSGNSEGFFYSRFDSDTLHSIHYHALGTPQDQDQLFYQNQQDGSVGYTPFISADNRYLIIDAFHGSAGPNTISCIDLAASKPQPVTIIPCDGASYWFICSRGTKLYFLTNKNAPFRKVICIDISKTPYVQQDAIPEGKFLLESIVSVGDYFGVVFSENIASTLVLFDAQGNKVRHIALPSIGKATLSRITQNSPAMEDELFFSFTNFFQPSTLYHYSIQSQTTEIFKKSTLNIDSGNFEIHQVFCKSKDGTQVPIFIAHKKGIQLNGRNPVLLTGYGAYGYIYYPTFNAANMAWIERGGIFALANIRGGNEYGEYWHNDAVREKKQNSFDDFIAAADWLIEHKYTQPTRLAAIGMSSGGLLVAAATNQRPDLFRAVVVEVGLLDMLRFHLFTIGRFWIAEHGNPDSPADRAYLKKYSPYHNVRAEITYPAILVTASQHDDRVVPSHSYKYVAALQQAHPENKKLLLRLNTQAGHDTSQSANWIEEQADILTFISQELAF